MLDDKDICPRFKIERNFLLLTITVLIMCYVRCNAIDAGLRLGSLDELTSLEI